MPLIYFFLFFSFFQVGLFGYGGSEGLLSLLQHEIVVEHGWLTSAEFANMLAVCRILPGEYGVQFATFVGYTALSEFGFFAALSGSLAAVVGLSLPSLLLTLVSEQHFVKFVSVDVRQNMMSLLRPLAPGLVAASILMLINEENFSSPTSEPWQFGVSIFLFLATLVGTRLFRFNALFMLLLCGVAGALLY